MNRFKRYLAVEIGIEFKASLYFWAILFYYCTYRLIIGIYQADILIIAEMIMTTYIMGYVQVYLLRNFEETDRLGLFEWVASLGCSVFYGVESYLLSWFARNPWVSLGFAFYMLVCYLCFIAVYYVKRKFDTEMLNQELNVYKRKGEQ